MSGRRPNILWIVTTQWRAQACGYAGDPNARTPTLDQLAAESINYTQAVTPHPFGPFARAALLTGVPSPENGLRDYFDPLPIGSRTIAHAMAERGYATAFFGKWHLGARDPRAPLVGDAHATTIVPPEARGGFEHWEGFESGFVLNAPWLHGTRLSEPTRFAGYQSDVLCQRAGDWLRETGAHARPVFCVVSLEPPHPPYDAAPGPRLDPAAIALRANVPLQGEVERAARRELAGYYAHIAATDRALGRLLEVVRELEARRHQPAMVVFTSVHGDMHGAHGLFRKGWPHEESVRVPLLVHHIGGRVVEAGARDDLVSLLDVPRWTRAWADERSREELAGSAQSDRQRISMPSVVALPHQCDRVWRGVRTRTRKLVQNADGSPWLLFDLERDPFEQQNLVERAGHAAELARLRTLI